MDKRFSTARLRIFDLGTKTARTVYETSDHIEAPNWSPCGTYLLVNAGGLLYRFDLAKGEMTPVPTDGLSKTNNDHGISPDGQWIFMSDHTEAAKSQIYRMKTTGGAPQKISPDAPSWWHGISPDGTRVAYPAVRGGVFGIYDLPVDGRDERCLVSSDHHYDGPDYTPDGNWIWFNSDRAGAMDLWRIACGAQKSELQRMFSDGAVNWFPHPCPKGENILFLAYPAGTAGHPGFLDVKLRMMPAAGGEAVDLMDIFGGQGSINVPCWAPKGDLFAYVDFLRQRGT